MHRVLEPLHELLEVGNSRLELPKAVLSRIDAGRLLRLSGRVGTAPKAAEPRDQSIKLRHSSTLTSALGRNRTRRIPPALFLGHLADHQRAALDLLTHQLELRLALLLGSLPCALHVVAATGRTTEAIPFGQPGRCRGFLARSSGTGARCALTR